MTLPNKKNYQVSKKFVGPPNNPTNTYGNVGAYSNGNQMNTFTSGPWREPLFPNTNYNGRHGPLSASPNYETREQTELFPQGDLLKLFPDHFPFDGSFPNGGGVPMTVPAPPHSNRNEILQNTRSLSQDSLFKGLHPMDLTFSTDEMSLRKSIIRSHRFLPTTMEIVSQSKKEGLLPPLNPLELEKYEEEDFSLDDYLHSHGIETSEKGGGGGTTLGGGIGIGGSIGGLGGGGGGGICDNKKQEFVMKVSQLKDKYKEELQKLNSFCSDYIQKLLSLLREQSQIRPVSEQESNLKVAAIQQKFDCLRSRLKENVINAIETLQRQYDVKFETSDINRKKRKAPPASPQKVSNGSFTVSWISEKGGIDHSYPTKNRKQH